MRKTSDIPTIAHEIKNLLSGISGAITVLFDDIPPDDPNKVIINEILSQTERLDKAVKKLLSFIVPVEGKKDV